MWSLWSTNPTKGHNNPTPTATDIQFTLGSGKNKSDSRADHREKFCQIHLFHLYLPSPLHIHLETTVREEHWQWYALSGMQWTIQCTFALYLTFRSSLTEWILILDCRYKTLKYLLHYTICIDVWIWNNTAVTLLFTFFQTVQCRVKIKKKTSLIAKTFIFVDLVLAKKMFFILTKQCVLSYGGFFSLLNQDSRPD